MFIAFSGTVKGAEFVLLMQMAPSLLDPLMETAFGVKNLNPQNLCALSGLQMENRFSSRSHPVKSTCMIHWAHLW